MTPDPKRGPLNGVLVVEFCQALAGPYCTQLMADLGARVIKIEKPGGDDSRSMPPHFIGDTSVYFMGPNRNKESIVLDLKSPEGRDIALKLVKGAQIVVENNRPGVMARLGLGFEDMKAVNRAIVYCSISGFGQDGPYRDFAAYDTIVQAMSGAMSLTGEKDGKPVRSGVPIGDLCAAMSAAFGAVSALHAAKASGEAQYVDVAMLDVQVSMMSYHLIYYLFSGVVPATQGNTHSGVPEQGEFECADGKAILVTPMAEAMWPALCRAVGRPDLLNDKTLGTRIGRMQHVERLRAEFETIYRGAPAADWVARLRAEGVPATTINSVDMVATDPQVAARGMIVDSDFAGSPLKLIGKSVRVAGQTDDYKSPPLLGANTLEILKSDLGMTPDEIAACLKNGSIQAG